MAPADPDLDAVRRFFAEELRAVCGLKTPALVDAFARVPRERFLGPGPWLIPRLELHAARYEPTATADPREVCHNVGVALDPARQLNNGQPSTLASWLDVCGAGRGQSVAHLGCGTGYYSALLAELVGPEGRVVALELDEALAQRARANLAPWPQAQVVASDGSELPAPLDLVFVNAGATHPRREWLEALAPGGRLLLPLTTEGFARGFGGSLPGSGGGFVLLATRSTEADRFAARFVSIVQIFHCANARTAEEQAALGALFGSGGWARTRSLRTHAHEPGPACLHHRNGWCLSSEPAPNDARR